MQCDVRVRYSNRYKGKNGLGEGVSVCVRGGVGGGWRVGREKQNKKRHRRCRVGVMGRWKGKPTFHHPQIRQCTLYFFSCAAQPEVQATRERTETLCLAAEEVDGITLS